MQLGSGGQLWASGAFQGFESWLQAHDIDVVVNLLCHQARPPAADIWHNFDMNGKDLPAAEGLEEVQGC